MNLRENHDGGEPVAAKVRVASIQMQVMSAEPLKNIVRAEGFINDAARAGANALLLPESGQPATLSTGSTRWLRSFTAKR